MSQLYQGLFYEKTTRVLFRRYGAYRKHYSPFSIHPSESKISFENFRDLTLWAFYWKGTRVTRREWNIFDSIIGPFGYRDDLHPLYRDKTNFCFCGLLLECQSGDFCVINVFTVYVKHSTQNRNCHLIYYQKSVVDTDDKSTVLITGTRNFI